MRSCPWASQGTLIPSLLDQSSQLLNLPNLNLANQNLANQNLANLI
jgi:hypothetical protein